MSEYTIFGYGNQLNRDDTDLSTREKRKVCKKYRNFTVIFYRNFTVFTVILFLSAKFPHQEVR